MSTAAATSVSPPTAKGTLPWRVDVIYRVNTLGNRRRNARPNDRLVCSPYYPLHDGQAACIKGRCVDNTVWLDGQRRCQCARQPEVQSKVDVLGGLPATTAEAAVQAKHRLNLARQIGKMATRIDRQFLATSYPLFV